MGTGFVSTERAIRDSFISPNVCDQNMEPANIVDVVNYVALGLARIANAITPLGVAGVGDACGNHVESLTEAMMGITRSAVQIAEAINNLAEAVREASE